MNPPRLGAKRAIEGQKNMEHFRFKLPDVGEGVVEAEIVEWRVSPGDVVNEDDPLVDVMTDKATVEIPSPVAGKIAETNGQPGDNVAVGSELVVIAMDGEHPAPVLSPPPAPELPAEIAPRPSADRRVLTSPSIRRRAREAGVDLSLVPGTGPKGRIRRQDFEAFLASQSRGQVVAPPRRSQVDEIKIIGLRRKIAENMQLSKRSIPHFAYVEEMDVTALEDLRAHLNNTRSADQPKLTLLPFLVRALDKALVDTPNANATFDAEAGILRRHDARHVGIATATSSGLFVPVIKHAETLDIWKLASEIKRLAEAARDGRASKEELSGSTITVTSLGPLGGIASTPIINAPEVAIIGVNKIVERPIFDGAGRVVPRLIMNLSSSFDHRIVDGQDAAKLIQRIKTFLENPATIFM